VKPNNEALKVLRAEIKEAQRLAILAKRIIERESEELAKAEVRIAALKLAETQLESLYE
jgi:hypothetical protein